MTGAARAQAAVCGPVFSQLPGFSPGSAYNELDGIDLVPGLSTGASSPFAFAVGRQFSRYTGGSLVLQGGELPWDLFANPTDGVWGANLEQVAAISPTNAWAVGVDGGALVEHWNGSAWHVQTIPPQGAGSQLTSVVALSPTDAWALGSIPMGETSPPTPFLLHWDGSSWRNATPPPAIGNFMQLSAASDSDMWAVGAQQSGTLAAHWDGVRWTVTPTPNPKGRDALVDVVDIAPGDAWAVGFKSILFGQYGVWDNTLAMHWDGSRWTAYPTPNDVTGAVPSGEIDAVAALSSNDVWAYGTPMLRWNGRAWIKMTSTTERGTLHIDIAADPDSGMVVGVGTGPVVNSTGTKLVSVQGVCPIVVDRGFSTKTVKERQGSLVQFYAPVDNRRTTTITDGSGIGLFTNTLAPGAGASIRFHAAGSYPVMDRSTSSRMSVRVPLRVTPRHGTTDTAFTVTWSDADPPTGIVEDVQLLRPGKTRWSTWKKGNTSQGAVFTPNAGRGEYRFRARLRSTASGRTTGWSPIRTISVT